MKTVQNNIEVGKKWMFLIALWQGILIALEPINLGLAVIGVVVGLFVGAMPGLGSVNGVAILLPFYIRHSELYRWSNLANDFPCVNLLWGNVWWGHIFHNTWHTGSINGGSDHL